MWIVYRMGFINLGGFFIRLDLRIINCYLNFFFDFDIDLIML